jgi:CHASE3 domain sensor protein
MMHQWTFQKKVTVGFTVMVCLAAITASVAVYALRVVVASKDRVITVNSQNLTNAARLNAAVGRRVDGFRGFLLVPEETFRNEMNAGTDDFVKVMRLLEQKVHIPRRANACSTMSKKSTRPWHLPRTESLSDEKPILPRNCCHESCSRGLFHIGRSSLIHLTSS